MFSKILVPLDGSELAERSLGLAVKLAAAANGEIVLLRVPVAEQVLTAPYSHLDTYHLEMSTARSRDLSIQYLEKIRSDFQDQEPVVRIRVEHGVPAEVILRVAVEEAVDLIIISSHGYSGIRKWVLGSVAEAILQRASIPVLVLHNEGELEKILITLDGSELSEIAIEPGFELAKHTGAEVIFLRIQDHLAYIDDNALEEMESSEKGMEELARRSVYTRVDPYLQKIEARYAHEPFSIEIASFVADDPARGIIDYARNRGVDCIVMATHGRSGLSRLMYGSVMEQVLSRFERSMLIIRPKT